MGFGRPAWIIQAYALQNVVCWLLLAWILTRWLPLDSARHVAAWAACLFAHGMLWSVYLALLDGPSALLIACAVMVAERGRQLTTAGIIGVAALGRETNLLGAVALKWPETRRDCLRAVLALALIVLPMLIWQDYLRSIYRSTAFTRQNLLDPPVLTYLDAWRRTFVQLSNSGFDSPARFALCGLASVSAQTLYLCWRREYGSPWWRVAVAYAALMLVVNSTVWAGYPGAITRVVLPLTIGFNVLLARHEGRGFWLWYVIGNLHLVPAVRLLQG
jgi:hypothetical protein